MIVQHVHSHHHVHSTPTRHVPFVSTICSDRRLHKFVARLDHDEFHRDRRFAGALDFVVDQAALLKHAHITTSFHNVRFDSCLLLTHTECAAVHDNDYYTTLQEKRHRFPAGPEGDLEFNKAMLYKLKRQTEKLPFAIDWHFGIILTDQVVQLTEGDAPLEIIVKEAIHWPFGMPPMEFFTSHIWEDHALRVA